MKVIEMGKIGQVKVGGLEMKKKAKHVDDNAKIFILAP